MEWFDPKEKVPDRKGSIISKIGSKYVVGRAYPYNEWKFAFSSEPFCHYEFDQKIEGLKIAAAKGWIKPDHYKDVEKWGWLDDDN